MIIYFFFTFACYTVVEIPMSFVSKFSFMLKCSINPVLREKLDSRNEVSICIKHCLLLCCNPCHQVILVCLCVIEE